MMLGRSVCSNCGCKFKTVETRYNEKSYVVYRLRECPNCKDTVFTREHIVKDSLDFRKKWNYNSRAAQGWRDSKKELRRLMRVAKSYSANGVDEDYESLKRKYAAMVELVGREPTDQEIAEITNSQMEEKEDYEEE